MQDVALGLRKFIFSSTVHPSGHFLWFINHIHHLVMFGNFSNPLQHTSLAFSFRIFAFSSPSIFFILYSIFPYLYTCLCVQLPVAGVLDEPYS
jgi:hypothetical protein